MPLKDNMIEVITLGAGCFWCIESAFNEVEGILSAVSGYMGGHTINPTYKEVCSGLTGHNEVVQVTYDPALIELDTILKLYWTLHDPTTPNRQGNDVGTQYRSGIYYYQDRQIPIIEKSIEKVAKELWEDPITTEVLPATIFYQAESYHQNYYKNNPNQGYCAYIITPKMAKFRKTFAHLLKHRHVV